jgi:TetR/AcrR family transcriptional regulator, transcriptional repressor for nem operon
MGRRGMRVPAQTVDQRNDFDGYSTTPGRVATLGGSSSPIIGGTDSAAELPKREAIVPLHGDSDETGETMTEASERPPGTTRQRLIAAASREFAHRSYSMVSLDDILAEAQLTKGAMYFHFQSKQALALAIIDDLHEMSQAAVTESLARRMSGLETLIDLIFLLAVQDTQDEVARAGVRLLETLDNTTIAPPTMWRSWIEVVTTLIQKAVTEGDVVDHDDPEDIAKMLVALWAGVRRINDSDQPESHLANLKTVWVLALPSFTNPDRIDYFTQFIRRRHALALNKLSAEPRSLDHRATAAAADADP